MEEKQQRHFAGIPHAQGVVEYQKHQCSPMNCSLVLRSEYWLYGAFLLSQSMLTLKETLPNVVLGLLGHPMGLEK